MNYTYTIEKYIPEDRWAKVKYQSEGHLPYYKLMTLVSLEESEIRNQIEGFFPFVKDHWEKVEQSINTSLPIALEEPQEKTFVADKEYIPPGEAPPVTFLQEKAEIVFEETDTQIIERWVVTPLTLEEKESYSRTHRDLLLRQSDSMMLSDSPSVPVEWLEYRQALRDVPQQVEFPLTIVWPEEPIKRTQADLDQDISYFRTTTKVSMRQARLALSRQGLLGQVQAGIDALSEESQIEWEYAGSVERNSPLVQSLGAALGLTDEQLDDLFKLAVTL